MSLPTAVIRPAADKNTASLFSQETKTIKALLKQYEARGYLTVDVLPCIPSGRLQSFLKGINRRKEVWAYHHIGPWEAGTWQEVHAELPGIKFLYISGPARQEHLVTCFKDGVQVVITTGSQAYGEKHLLFAKKFYANLAAGTRLEEAFEQARLFVEMEQAQPVQKPMQFSYWLADQAAGKKDIPWGIFYSLEGSALLSLSLPQKSELRMLSKQEQISWLARQRFKDAFLKNWGQASHHFLLATILDGPLGIGQLCQAIKEEICLPYLHAGVRTLKIDFATTLAEAQVKLLEQMEKFANTFLAIDSGNEAVSVRMNRADGIVLLLKIFQSEWPSYGAKLLEWLKETVIPALYAPDSQADVICVCAVIEDEVELSKKNHAAASIKRIVDSCKLFAADECIDFRL